MFDRHVNLHRKTNETLKRTIILLFLLTMLFPAMAQEDFYDADKIQEIRIIFHEKNWKHLLDSVFTASKGNDRWMCDLSLIHI